MTRSFHLFGIASAVAISAVLAGCSDASPIADIDQPQKPSSTSGPSFTCGVSYSTTTTVQDSDLAYYGVPELTETHDVCEIWTGSDYRVHAQRTSTSEPNTEWSDDMGGVTYEYGQTTALATAGGELAEPSSVGSDGFVFGQATPEERQASYNDPYYGVYQGVDPEGCPGNPGAIICDDPYMYTRTPAGAVMNRVGIGKAPGNPEAAKVGTREHGLKRRALRALLAASEELPRSREGFRRFRSARTVNGQAHETVITVDPATELMVAQDTREPAGTTSARLTWTRVKGRDGKVRFVRTRMDVDGLTAGEEQPHTSRAVILISNLQLAGAR